MKKATVLIAGAGEDNLRDIEVPVGASAGDVLDALNLDGYILSRADSSQTFAKEEEIYEAIPAGGKLRAVPIAEVGIGLTTISTWSQLW